MSRRSSIRVSTSSFDGAPNIPFLGYPQNRPHVRCKLVKCAAQMIKVLVAALVGTIIGIVVMVAVIAISGTDTSGASSVGIGSLPLSTFSPSATNPPSTVTSNPTSGGTNPASSGGGATGDANAGKAVFASAGCSGCHTLAAAGASATVGPDLDTALTGDAAGTPLPQFVKDSIINPDAVIAKGFTAGIMPTNFGSTLSATDIDNLVALIVQGK